ncbi:beta-ketoacyl synthase N-terminal-like domain-containing protein [Escherichia coli]|uniref:beta-ketoacyl synthase N-terminal-like domain-containing protein n=1 Tax=Escherichia coli TaxID=562 RepID=UPI003CCC6678
MIYISAVGMINALGNNLDEIAANLARGVAPGMRPRAGCCRGIAGGPGWRGWRGFRLSRKNSRCASLAQQSDPAGGAVAQLQPQVDDANRETMAASASRLCLAPAPPACMKATRTLTCTPTGIRAPRGTMHNKNSAIRRVVLSPGWRSTARLIPFQPPSPPVQSNDQRAQLIEAGLVDAAIVGGADTLSRMRLTVFHSLEFAVANLMSAVSRDRAGITIGEGAGLMLLTREPQPIALLGVGESSDAYHISAPHPQGEGAIRAINQALTDAQLTPDDVGYINLHGTATQLNDQIESMVVNALFGERVPCSSTKHLTGHTLGAAGITEAAISMLILQRDLPLPAQDFSLSPRDPTLPPCGIIEKPQPLARPVILSNSFAFGGNNASILLGRVS